MMTANKMVLDAKFVGEWLKLKTPDQPAPTPSRPDEWIIYLPSSIFRVTFLWPPKAPKERSWDNLRLAKQSHRPGYWGVIPCLPGSARKGRNGNEEEVRQIMDTLSTDYQRTPLPVTLLLLSGAIQLGSNPLNGGRILCPERFRPENSAVDFPIEVGIEHGPSVFVGYEFSVHCPSHFLSAARWICD